MSDRARTPSFLRARAASAIGALASLFVAVPLEAEPRVEVSSHRAVRKESGASAAAESEASLSPTPLLGTLVQVHTGEHLAISDREPTQARFDALLADRTTGETHALDPRLLELLRAVAGKFPGARVELVSGFRSPKLNERLRKKGHNVASHSQHSLGHAVDFRIVPSFDDSHDGHDAHDAHDAKEANGARDPREGPAPVEPAALESVIRALGWSGGVGVYPGESDRFVHADVGPRRRWIGH